jgi:hypothetical protein
MEKEQGTSKALYNMRFDKSITLVKEEYSLRDIKYSTEVIKGAGSLLEFQGGSYLVIALKESEEVILLDKDDIHSIILDKKESEDV